MIHKQHDLVDIMHYDSHSAWYCGHNALIHKQHDIIDIMHYDSQTAWYCRYIEHIVTISMILTIWCTMIHKQHDIVDMMHYDSQTAG